jgi:hypothetical protein
MVGLVSLVITKKTWGGRTKVFAFALPALSDTASAAAAAAIKIFEFMANPQRLRPAINCDVADICCQLG